MRTLIVYATAGIGHKKAALSVKEAFDRNGREATLIDVIDYASPLFKITYNSVYLFLVNNLKGIWGFFYYVLDNRWVYAALAWLRRLVNHINTTRLVAYLLRENPDTVITTHFMASEVMADLKKRGLLKTRLITVITDYQSHIFWLSDFVDLYVVGSDYTGDDLVKRGVPREKVRVLGIPCGAAFSKKHDRAALQSRFGLDRSKNTVFIIGGGFGVGPIQKLVRNLDASDEDFQGIVVCGYNKTLRKDLEEFSRSARHAFKVFGFVDNVDELMAVSDVLVSKSGGISVTEALAMSLPMVVVSPIPGQEMRNWRFLETQNAAVRMRHPGEIVAIIGDLFGSHKIEILKKNIERVRHTDSAERIMHEADH